VRRLAVVAAVVVVALGAAGIAALARHGSGGGKTVTSIAGHEIKQSEVDLTVDHFHEEADTEGKPFPAKGTREYAQVEKLATGLLVDRAKIEAAAGKIGVHVTGAQVDARLAVHSAEQEGSAIRVKAEAAFRRATAQAQLVTEAVFRKVTAAIRVTPAEVRAYYDAHRAGYGTALFPAVAPGIRRQLLAARKNAAMARWLASARKQR
jgi:hypothetical protein